MRNLVRIAMFLVSLGVVFGAQSVRVSGGTQWVWAPSVTLPNSTPWNGIGASAQAMRWEMRIHDFGADWPFLGINMGPVVLWKPQPPSSASADVVADSLFNSDTIGDNGVFIQSCCSGRTDVLVRVQRDVANRQYTFEVCDTTGGNCQSSTSPIKVFGQVSWAGLTIGLSTGYSTAFLRWFSSVVPLGTLIPIAGVTGDLGDWEFEGYLTDSSGHGLNMTGGSYTYVPTPTYPPRCNAGNQQAFRAGYLGRLDGSGSAPLDGGSTLSYVWQQVSGPSKVRWSGQSRRPPLAPTTHTSAQPVITGLIAGSYTFQLTVTDGSGHSSQCTVNDGAVATDNNDVVITDNPVVDTLLGPMIRFGANPWPWFDDRHKAEADMQIAIMDQYYGAYWDVADPGTITITAGSATVTGTGTSFTTLFCQGPGSPNTPISGVTMVTWYPTGIPGQTGRREMAVASCQSDTQLTLSPAWTNDVPGGSGLNYSDNLNRQAWSYNAAPANYYDNVAAFYALYYRSGIVDYLNAARKLADRFWECPQIDRGASFVGNGNGGAFPGRSASVMGLVLRALDGRPDMWAGLHKIWDFFGVEYIGSGPGTDDFDLLWGPGLWDEREVAYHLAMISYCALYDPDPGYQSKCKTWVSGAISGLFTQTRFADGGWHGLGANYDSWTTPPTTVTLTHGSTTVTGNGTSWTPDQFAIISGLPPYMWFTNASSKPASNADGDPVFYNPAFVDATHLMLDRPYEGATGTHGWDVVTASIITPLLGYGSLPYMEGILGVAFDFAAMAIADSDPQNSALAHTYNVGVANWIRSYGYRAAVVAVYYGAQFINCQKPIPETQNPCVGAPDPASSARVLSAEAIRAVMSAYAYSKDPGLRSFADLLFNAMWAKPGTCPAGSTVCVPDGSYVSAYDDNGWNMTGTPPVGQAPKWFGDVWGFSGLSAWPAVRIGGPQPSSTGTVYVGFNLRGVQGAAKVGVTTTAPDGTVSQVQCSSSPCGVPSPGPPGDRLIQLQYLSGSGKILATSDASLVPAQ